MSTPSLSSAESILELEPFGQPSAQKSATLLAQLSALTAHHRAASAPYADMVNAIFGPDTTYAGLSALPWLPVSLFKRIDLKSVPDDRVVRTLVSSGTTGQAVSRIFLDKDTAGSQTKALTRITTDFIGRQRMPMVIIDDDSFLKDRTKFNARGAAIIGFSNFGRAPLYALNERLMPDWDALTAYVEKHSDRPILLFGFTFIVWQQFVQQAQKDGISLRFPAGSILVHGGGWKRLIDKQVSNNDFKAGLADTFGVEQVHNYYGMVEQVGSVFFECEHGWLHTPAYADVIIRDRMSFAPLHFGQEGLVQVLSLLPRSYPGHSLLTEDLGTVHGEDDCACGRLGKRFSVSGRLPNVEVRGCSDTRATPA